MNIQCAHTKLEDIHKLVPHPRNANTHPDKQIDLLAKIIDHQGQRVPIVVSSLSGFITKGHGRLMAIKKLGWDQCAIDVQDYESEAQEFADLIADNKIAELAAHDDNLMIEGIQELGIDDFDLLGIPDFELPAEPVEAQCDEDSVPENVDTRCKKGDVWILGEHRLVCGDSTSIYDVEKLMDGAKADMVYTDPPYGINEQCDRDFASRTRKARGNSFKQIEGDENTDVAKEFCNFWIGLNIEKYVIWGANHFAHALPESPEWLAWDKREEEKERDMNSDIELAWVRSGKKSARIFRHKWKGMIKASEHGQARVHPTQKPIALAEWCLDEYKVGNNVFDGFGGSGSTLIACEKTNRKCYMMELDEHYCDVILKRYEDYTGKEAQLCVEE